MSEARNRSSSGRSLATAAVCVAALLPASPATASPPARTAAVASEAQLRRAWADPRVGRIVLTADLRLEACRTREPVRAATTPVVLDGRHHEIRQTCFERRVLRQDGRGVVRLLDVTLSHGGTDGAGAGIAARGDVEVVGSTISQNLSEEQGGGVYAGGRATIVRSAVTGNLANDDGGGVYAGRGGVHVRDSDVSGNVVDGSGGGIGSTGEIVVERSHLDGNTTDGDGGAIYADGRANVTVVDSTVDGSTADGPGGAIFTVGGDVVVLRSSLSGNRADDRGGAIAGEADVTVIDSTIARNAAVAHVGGGIWARGNLAVRNSTVSDNYAEGEGGGVLGARSVTLEHATILDNVAPVAANVGAGQQLTAFGSAIGPASTAALAGRIQPTGPACRAPRATSLGYNAVVDRSCGLRSPTDLLGLRRPRLRRLADLGGIGETRMPAPQSPLIDRIPAAACGPARLPLTPFAARALAPYGITAGGATDADARGVPRPQGSGCDIGAVEAGGSAPAAEPDRARAGH